MASTKILLSYGALLHDVGKVLNRGLPTEGAHSQLGADFIVEKVAPLNDDFSGDDGRKIVEQIRFHHWSELEAVPDVPADSLAYITCFANGISAGIDCPNEGAEGLASPLDRDASLRKIFNTLNGNHDDATIEHESYGNIEAALSDGLAQIGVGSDEVNALLGLLENTMGAIPASLDPKGMIDVPLYDHARVTAGIAACVYEYLREREEHDYHKALFGLDEGLDARAEEMFLFYSCDMSGIQDFIYNISGSGALKQLRARSMYLELLLEHIVDELLERLGLCRANLLYTGGGHAYLLLPNTEVTKATLQSFADELGAWFIGNYKTDLYVASAWVECCADDLANRGDDKRRYPKLYRLLSRRLSEAKAARYDAETIRTLNFRTEGRYDHGRECSECHRSDLHINEDGKCTLCASLGGISKSLVDRDVFVVDSDDVQGNAHPHHVGLALPFGCQLRMYTSAGYRGRRAPARRVYVKNASSAADGHATRIWMGDYTADVPRDEGISAFAAQGVTLASGKGIQRLGVLRADVDDLGATFVSGLPDDMVSISRTSTLSRSLSIFFKSKINEILQQGGYQVQIIYSGGDDLFIVGNWSDVLYAAIDIRKALDDYTGNGLLTISAGIGIFGDTYPIARMASETGDLEDRAKHYSEKGTGKTKNAIALWSAEHVFGWDEFIDSVEPRMRELGGMFESNQKGTAFIYRLIDLLRGFDSLASAPRLAYLLARSFEDDKAHGSDASRKLYEWAQDPTERRRLIVALEWYVLSIREGSDE